jgi:hypothetical protein
MDIQENKKLQFDEEAIKELKEIRKWANMLSVCGFIFIGLIVILGSGYFIYIMMNFDVPEVASLRVAPLLLLGSVYFFPVYYLFRFSVYAKRALLEFDNKNLNVSLRYLKLHYRYMGILLILIFFFYLVAGVILFFKGQLFY